MFYWKFRVDSIAQKSFFERSRVAALPAPTVVQRMRALPPFAKPTWRSGPFSRLDASTGFLWRKIAQCIWMAEKWPGLLPSGSVRVISVFFYFNRDSFCSTVFLWDRGFEARKIFHKRKRLLPISMYLNALCFEIWSWFNLFVRKRSR